MAETNILDGKEFGKLTVLKRSNEGSMKSKIYYECKCACGVTKVVPKRNLLAGKTLSCGCLRREKARERMVSKSETYDGLTVREISEKSTYNMSTVRYKLAQGLNVTQIIAEGNIPGRLR